VGSGYAADAMLEALHLRHRDPIRQLYLSDEEIFSLAGVPHAPGRTFLDLRPYVIVNQPDGGEQ
jgi:hypothetical protein